MDLSDEERTQNEAKGIDTMITPKIKEFKRWTRYTVREACIRNDLYTCGCNEEYEHMLDWVDRLYPNTENIHYIAENIFRNSKDQTVSNIMFILANEAVNTCYEIEGEQQ